MKMPRTILRALNVHREEWWLVQKLFLLQFFQGAGIAFFFTSAFSQFLQTSPVTGLAYVFILAAVLLWIAGFIYSKLEHRLHPARLNIIVTIFLAGSMVIFWLGAAFIHADWFYFLMLAWFYVLYLLNNLMFWGMAATLYDVRQSKRLFGVISAGDIPAKFIGYSVASVIVYYIGTINLLLAGFLFILFSFPFLLRILEKNNSHKHIHPDEATHHTAGVHNIMKDYSVNLLVRRVALLSLIVSGCIIFINYAFYAEVKSQYKNDVELARVIALFLAGARLAAMLIKIVFTSRLLYWLGNKTSLIITPAMLVVLVFIILLTDTMTYNNRIILYIFGVSAILTDVLNSAINSPVLLTIMQPLSGVERLRAHNIVKGIMDPFAYFLSGIILLVSYKFNFYTIQFLGYVLLFIAVAWIIGIFKVHQQYLKMLIKAISSRFFSQEDFNIYDPAARVMIAEKIKTGTELEVLYILRMLGSRKTEESIGLILEALRHPSEKVVTDALRLARELHLKEAEPVILPLIQTHPDDFIRSEAIKVFSSISYRDEIIAPLMNSAEDMTRRAAIITVLNHSESAVLKNEAESNIKKLLDSENDLHKLEAAHIIYETHDVRFDEEIIQLLGTTNPELNLAVIRVLGHHATDRCLESLMEKIDAFENPVLEALIIGREKSLPFILKRILSDKCSSKQKEKLIATIGRIGSKAAHELLFEMLHLLPADQPYILKILHRCHFKANKNTQPYLETLVRKNLVAAAGILHMQKNIPHQHEYNRILTGSLQLELLELRETLLYLFSFLYDRDQIGKIQAAIEINKKETQANAIELVDMTVKKEFANPFNAAFEEGDVEYRCNLLKNIFPKDIYPGLYPVVHELLEDKNLFYNDWTKSCSLYITKKSTLSVHQELILKYRHAENRVLKETADFASGNS
jgi:HEAT repeat protein